MPHPDPIAPALSRARLYAFVDTAYLHGRDPVDVAARLCEGGADIIQFRAKDWTREMIMPVAASLLAVCEINGVPLVLNDHPDIAARIGAPLAHLGQEDFFDAGHTHVSDLKLPAPAPAIGLSTHAPDQAERALRAGAAYVAIGPVFPTPTKPGRPAVSLEYVRWAAQNITTVPWFAIGGITLANLDAVLGAGARRVCVVSAILNASDIAAACAEFRRNL